MNELEAIAAAREILQDSCGLVSDEHGRDTATRFLSMLQDMTACKDSSGEHIASCIKWKDFESDIDQLIMVERIPFVSVCNHHVVPFVGYAHIGYIPDGWIAGLSKFGRVVKHFSRQLQVQERLTEQVHDFITDQLNPLGVAVTLRAEHMCMTLRGVQMPGAYTTTSKMSGVFNDHDRTAKAEFLSYVNGNGHR